MSCGLKITGQRDIESQSCFPTSRYCVRTLWGHDDWVRSVVPSEDGKWLVSASNDQVSHARHSFDSLMPQKS